MSLSRRGFLGAAALGILAARVRVAFADTSLDAIGKPSNRVGVDVAAALQRAQRAGKPLLVLVIPADDDKKYDRGHLFGELLHHGNAEDLGRLAHADVVCATMAQVRKAAPGLKGDPLLVHLSDGAPRVFSTDYPAWPNRRVRDLSQPEPPSDDQVVSDRVARLSALLREALPGTPASGDVELARAQLVKRPPQGAHWARGGGCGQTIEETPEEIAYREAQERADLEKGIMRGRSIVGYGCGMGHVPAKSTRFLYFFAKGSDD